ncbi:MAG: tRNA lysidine(34) synthetase TilS [Actinomycetota bacterium]|nr:tRNA lysidine(34) synthetase TilS [Actinomycetota bacterium]
MTAVHPAVAQVRGAVHRFLAAHCPGSAVAVACSGGADSLALAAATVHSAVGLHGGARVHGRVPMHGGVAVHGLVVDHGLQPDSAQVAAVAAAALRSLGCTTVTVLPTTVDGPGGPEAAARRARYAALRAAAPAGALVLLGHTRDDQAETVLLGLGRGSGPRSIAGMREHDPPWGRPLLDVPRSVTVAACAAQGLRPWCDPHNADPRFRRVRLRTEVLPLLEEVLAGGVAGALARTAAQLREDLDVLDALAAALLASAHRDGALEESTLDAPTLARHPAAVRRRVLREWLFAGGVTELTDAHLRACDDLVGRWRGQGEVALPGGFVVARAHGRLRLDRSPRPPEVS